jgi:hypothetical protein
VKVLRGHSVWFWLVVVFILWAVASWVIGVMAFDFPTLNGVP